MQGPELERPELFIEESSDMFYNTVYRNIGC